MECRATMFKQGRYLLGSLGLGLALTVFVGGCERAEFEGIRMPEMPKLQDPKGPHGGPTESAPDDGEAVIYEPGPPLELGTWPGRDGRHTFAMTWLGGDDPVGLRTKPEDEAVESGSVTWLDGTAIDWKDTRIIVTHPQIYLTASAQSWKGSPYDPRDELILDEEVTVEFKPGELVRLYGDAGEQQCYVGRGEAFFVVDCAVLAMGLERVVPAELVEGKGPWTPVESQWWILVDGDGERGWWKVDENLVEVRAIPMAD